jgi:hypothetical protein
MIPIYSFYGIPSTYLIIGRHFQHETTGVEKLGRWISGLAFPLIICFVGLNVLNRLAARANGDTSTALLLATSSAQLIMHVLFLSLCIFVSKGLQQINLDNETPIIAIENQTEWEAM